MRDNVRVTNAPTSTSEGTTSLKPFLRWAGGKRQLLSVLTKAFPSDFELGKNNYFEPFVGGGAVLMSLPSSPFWKSEGEAQGSMFINDVNEELIGVYQTLKATPEALIQALRGLSGDISEDRFYEVRASNPRTPVTRAARFIYLNRLCFNGLHRVNSQGGFNVPYGKLRNPTVCDNDLLLAVSNLLGAVNISSGGFDEAISSAKRGDLVYFDPPYVPLTATASFSKYSEGDFGEADQCRLAEAIGNLTERGVRVVLSNSSSPVARRIFQEHLSLFAVKANRSISASGASRKVVDEILGFSYSSAEFSDRSVTASLRRLKPLSVKK